MNQLKHAKSRSGSQRDLNQFELHEEAFRTLNVTAGDLLSRTHEELVLLLIQLRRQNSITARSIEQCCSDIHDVQNRIRTCEGSARNANLTRLEQLKRQLADLEKQYDKSKPLVNLVDNMVKLGSLYRNGTAAPTVTIQNGIPSESVTLDRFDFNQRMQERRQLQEEQKHWNRVDPDHSLLQSKVQQLYKLDQLLHEESGTVQGLQRDKEDLERSLGSLRKRLHDGYGPPQALDAARKHQHTLERELSRVHQLLADNSKKLEQTVADNARLEQDLLVLRQKLQASRSRGGSQTNLHSEIDANGTNGSTAVLENELRRVQHLVGDMQRQRQELSQAVRQLTENSPNISLGLGRSSSGISKSTSSMGIDMMPGGREDLDMSSNSNELTVIKKRSNSIVGWTETDLDAMYSIDFGTSADTSSIRMFGMSEGGQSFNESSTTPLYIDTGNQNKLAGRSYIDSNNAINQHVVLATAENQFYATEKPEPKTVRIVKRESERRHRERGSNGTSNNHLELVDELNDDHRNTILDEYNRSRSLPRSYLDTNALYTQPQLHSKHTLLPDNWSSITTATSSPAIPRKYSVNYNMEQDGEPGFATNSMWMRQHKSDRPTPLVSANEWSGVPTADTNPFSMYMAEEHTKRRQPSMHQQEATLIGDPEGRLGQHYGSASGIHNKTASLQSLSKIIGSPVFQSEAARQIITEISSTEIDKDDTSNSQAASIKLTTKSKRSTGVRTRSEDKRRYMTAPSHTISAKSLLNIQTENDMNSNNTNRARDDLDMEVALRPRINAPDVVRSALGQREKISENSIDRLFAAPSKIVIPERYIPEQTPELSPEEKKRRQEKVEAIKKMLSDAPINQSNDSTLPQGQISAEKKQREHLLQLNQILAQQVMQMSKIVAERAMTDNIEELNNESDPDDDSDESAKPIYQQRECLFFS